MAEYENFTEINENFDTIKTLLNSIRAQGILNTSDVDKLLTGINAKLEKINTEEDIDLIKLFLSELKQNLDERHGVLVSKFAAIESLFSNLLKNSSEMPKSSDIKELFDIVATNLSVFSREVVSQKDVLTDITLRIDAMRSDDTQKKDIIKNIALLKSDLERLNNGFDSIVINLNDNFKTIAKTISALDKSEYLDKFANNLSSIEMSSNTVLSALQVLDKKTEHVESSIQELATKADLETVNKKLFDLSAGNHELNASLNNLYEKQIKFDNLNEKIDASVNVIATLKASLEEADDLKIQQLIEKLNSIQTDVVNAVTNAEFDSLKGDLQLAFKDIFSKEEVLVKYTSITNEELKKLSELIIGLELDLNLKELFALYGKTEADLKQAILESEQRILNLSDANITRVLNDLSSNADSLTSKINNTQASLSMLFEKNFGSVFTNINELRNVLSQIEENSLSADNAIFSSITDRLTMFEEDLRSSLKSNEKSILESSSQVVEQVENIKNISSLLDYKLDSSVVEIGNVKREFSSLQESVEKVLDLNFVSVVKDFRVDLYASKQDLINLLEDSKTELTENIKKDLYTKYEALGAKLDVVETGLQKTQTESLNEIKFLLEKITGSIIDVLSYVSEAKNSDFENIDEKVKSILEALKENDITYIENVREEVDKLKHQLELDLKHLEGNLERNSDDIQKSINEKIEEKVDSVLVALKENENSCAENVKNEADALKEHVETNLGKMQGVSEQQFDSIKKVVSENTDDVKKDLKFSYNKLLEIQDFYNDFKQSFDNNGFSVNEKLDIISTSTIGIKDDFDSKLSRVKAELLERINMFKQEFTCENADKVSEFKFLTENLQNNNKNILTSLLEEQKVLLKEISQENSEARLQALDTISTNFVTLKQLLEEFDNKSSEQLSRKVEMLLESFNVMKETLDKVDENVDGDMTRQMSIIESNFESLVSQISILFDKYDLNVANRINNEFELVLEKMRSVLSEKLDLYIDKIEGSFDNIEKKNTSSAEYLQERIVNLNTLLKDILEEQATASSNQLKDISDNLKLILDDNIQAVSLDSAEIKDKLLVFSENIEKNIEAIKTNLDVTLKSSQNILSEDLNSSLEKTEENIDVKLNNIREITTELLTKNSESLEEFVDKVANQVELQKQSIQVAQDLILVTLKEELALTTKNIEKETDTIVAELIEQFELLKMSQKDDVLNLTSRIEDIVSSQIYNNVEDLKSYLDIKTDDSILSNKLDNLKLELSSSFGTIIENLNNLLGVGVFKSAMADLLVANEVLVNTGLDRLNNRVEAFISDNISSVNDSLAKDIENFESKLSIFNEDLKQVLLENYETIISLSKEQDSSLIDIQNSMLDLFKDFDNVRVGIQDKLNELKSSIDNASLNTSKELQILNENFESLRSQISNKSFDEAFQASINKQIESLENLISEQLGYIEDINDLCVTNLPDVTELNTLVKGAILESIKEFSAKIEAQDFEGAIDRSVKELKSDIITQFINIFNQISFVAEQEEILDFIQEKHDELITILSHIVTTSEDISHIKDSVAQLNDKINSIISSDGDIDYIYSLHDLESDIANLRLVLNEIQDSNKGADFANLLQSTEDIYNLVESVKSEMPNRTDFEDLTEDIESISSRTNKLLLASDESYKVLQDNLQEFKLVINDLDERTRNFAQESGMDRLDAKLSAINQMMQTGAKSNQVFNQVFEYLAEWVDNASVQINSISDKVESLDEIGQIKTMISDMKAQDDAESTELVDALGVVFNKQTKKISSLEKKLDKIIVETTINNKSIDLSPMEDTLNKFLVAMDEKFTAQQEKINLLETKLESVMSILDEKESAQLSKKVGGMDRQIAKLN